jgi:hypothetical protein
LAPSIRALTRDIKLKQERSRLINRGRNDEQPRVKLGGLNTQRDNNEKWDKRATAYDHMTKIYSERKRGRERERDKGRGLDHNY